MEPLQRSALSLGGATKQGYLFKEAGMGKKKRQWFILHEEYLYCFADDGSKKPKAVFNLAEYTDLEVMEDSNGKRDAGFKLYNPNPPSGSKTYKTLICSAGKVFERDGWAEALGSTLKNIHDVRTKYSAQSDERLEATIYVKLSDCKFKENPEGEERDTFATIASDNIQKARTPTIFNSNKPVYLQEYEFPVHPSLETIRIEVKECKKKKNQTIGQCIICIDDLRDQQVRDGWHNLTYVPSTMESGGQWTIKGTDVEVALLEAVDIKPDAVVTITYGPHTWKSEPAKKKKSNFSWKDQKSTFQVQSTPLIFSVSAGPDFLGEIKVSPTKLQDYSEKEPLWWELKEKTQEQAQVVGQLKITTHYKETVILPDKGYESLFALLFSNEMTLTKRLASVSHQKEKPVAEALVKAFEMRTMAVGYIKAITEMEISETSSAPVIFRGNTVATKSVDMYMRLTGLPYLHHCVKDIAREIWLNGGGNGAKKKKSCELDATRLGEVAKGREDKILAANCKTLLDYTSRIWKNIRRSLDVCPANFRNIFNDIQKRVIVKFPDDELCRYTAIAGFIFLRFFCPSFLAPKNFKLLDDHPPPTVGRDLTLVAKILQNLANLVVFGKKETFMEPCNEWLLKQQPKMKLFLDTLASLPTSPIDEIPSKRNTLFWGREMATLHFHLQESLPQILENFPVDETSTTLTKILTELDQEVESATGRTRQKSATPRPPLNCIHKASSTRSGDFTGSLEGSESIAVGTPRSPTKGLSKKGYNKIFSVSRLENDPKGLASPKTAREEKESADDSEKKKDKKDKKTKKDKKKDDGKDEKKEDKKKDGKKEEKKDGKKEEKKDDGKDEKKKDKKKDGKKDEKKDATTPPTESNADSGEQDGVDAERKRCVFCEKSIDPNDANVELWDDASLAHSMCLYYYVKITQTEK